MPLCDDNIEYRIKRQKESGNVSLEQLKYKAAFRRLNKKQPMQSTTKTQWSLLPFRELEDVARAFMAGNDKEGREPNDWQTKQTWQACIDAAMRHIINYQIKGRYDDDGIKHISQAIARLLMIDWFDNEGK